MCVNILLVLLISVYCSKCNSTKSSIATSLNAYWDSSRSLLQSKDNLNTTDTLLKYLCVSTITTECKDYIYDPITNKTALNISDYHSNLTIQGIPGEPIAFYVFGFDSSGDILSTSQYSIYVDGDDATIITPYGVELELDGQYYVYIVSLIIEFALNDDAFIFVYDENDHTSNQSSSISIPLIITDCDPGYYQKAIAITSNYFECDYCAVDTYTMGQSPCIDCPLGFECYGGNVLYVKFNWYGKVGEDSCLEDADNSYITSSLCPPGYCCNRSKCRFPNKFDYTYDKCVNNGTETQHRWSDSIILSNSTSLELCATNRDPSVPMCGACLPGYYETMSSVGKCAKCDEDGASNEWLVPFWFMVVFVVVYFFYFMGKRESTIPHPFMTYLSKTLLFFYQVLTFLTFGHSLPVISPLAELCNLYVNHYIVDLALI